jgi:hypothetical protein
MAPVTLSGEQIEEIRQRAARAIAPLKPPDAGKRYVMGSARTKGGRALPRHYFVYFLLVELLKFPHTGQEEKVAWTIPVAYGDDFAFVEYRKMGLGIFSKATAKDEGVAKDIVAAIKRGVGASVPFFDHLAAKAVESSLLNVTNNSDWLFNRYEYLRDQFRERIAEARPQG